MHSAIATCDESVSGAGTAPHAPSLVDTRAAAPAFAHVYIDGFFASVEQTLRPKFRGRPVLVTFAGRSGKEGGRVVISASYEARLLGVKMGMPLENALGVCPQAAVVPCRFPLYAEYAEAVRAVQEGFSASVQPDSSDGFYLDFSAVVGARPLDDLAGTLRRLQLEILKRTGLSASVGAAGSRVAAAVASHLERPRGLRIVPAGSEAAWLANFPIEALHGINQIDSSDLRKRSVRSISELRRVPLASLESAFGQSFARQVWENSRGRDRQVTKSRSLAPSLLREFAFACHAADLGPICEYLCARLNLALLDSKCEARTLAVRVSYADQFSASQSLRLSDFPSMPSADLVSLVAHSKNVLQNLFTRPVAIRSVAMTTTTTPCTTKSPRIETELAATA